LKKKVNPTEKTLHCNIRCSGTEVYHLRCLLSNIISYIITRWRSSYAFAFGSTILSVRFFRCIRPHFLVNFWIFEIYGVSARTKGGWQRGIFWTRVL